MVLTSQAFLSMEIFMEKENWLTNRKIMFTRVLFSKEKSRGLELKYIQMVLTLRAILKITKRTDQG